MADELKTLRLGLSALLADALDVADTPLGGQVNPPLALVQAGDPYLTAAEGYCLDAITFEAIVLAPPGDPPAVFDALDDLIDLVRGTLNGSGYGFQTVSGYGQYTYGDKTYPSVVVTVTKKRNTPNA